MRTPERSPERDAALEAMLPNVPFDGWTYRALRTGLKSIGVDPRDAELLFPGGARDMIEAFSDLADRRMEQAAGTEDFAGLRTPERVRRVILLRLAQNAGRKEAVRRALAILSLPGNATLAATCTARTVDSIWHAAGDRATDFSWYTKRAILAGVYSAAVLYWLRDTSEANEATIAFLDRRLQDVGRITQARRRIEERMERLASMLPGFGSLRRAEG
jgi:ubiquinone biosynthesis protein COQ9